MYRRHLMFLYSMLPIQEWFDVDKGPRDAEYANRVIRWVRMQMQPLVNVANASLGMDYLLARQDMSAIEILFQNLAKLNLTNRPANTVIAKAFLDDPEGKRGGEQNIAEEMVGVNFRSLPLLEKARNIITAEMKKMGPVISVQANDPTSSELRKRDEALLRNKKEIESFLTYIYTSIGQKPYKMADHEARFGDKAEAGNLQQFNEMGLEEGDSDDISFFMSNYYKLDWEIDLQAILDAITTYNEVNTRTIELWVTDCLAKKAVAAQAFVDDITGAVSYDYLTPETTYIYGGGRRKDYNDANAKAKQQLVTVKEFLSRVGNAFDFEKDVDKLVLAVFTASNGSIDITGINPDLRGYGTSDWFCQTKQTTYSYNQFMQFKVLLGYMEWISQSETEYGEEVQANARKFYNVKKEKELDKSANKKKGKKAKGMESNDTQFQNNQNPDGKRCQSKARYETPTYKAWYLAITMIDHIMFDFDKLSYQQIKGYNDVQTNFSIVTYKEIGDPIAISCIHYIDIIMECWYKWKSEIRRAKSRGTNYNYDSLMSIAERLYGDTEMREEEKFNKIISWRNKSANGVWTFPIVDGKPVIMTTAQLDQDMNNGLAPEIMKYWEIMANANSQMIDMIMGTANLRQGDSPSDRSSMNNEFKALESSQEATAYIPDMITYMSKQLAVRSSLFVQDIINFKEYDTLAYKWLVDLVGSDKLDTVENAGKTALHRYGIFVESFNTSAARMKLANRIDFAIQGGRISNAQALLVEDIKNVKLAARTLAYMEQRTDKLKQKQAMQLAQQQQQGQMELKQMELQLEKVKGDYKILEAKITANATIQSHLINAKAGITKTDMKNNADSQQIAQQAQADIAREQQNTDSTGKPSAAAPPPIQQQPKGPPPQPPQGPQSAIQQQIAATQPQAAETV